jgi:hypothetical protein
VFFFYRDGDWDREGGGGGGGFWGVFEGCFGGVSFGGWGWGGRGGGKRVCVGRGMRLLNELDCVELIEGLF